MCASQRRASRGFTLLEVLVAISILGLGLTVILSSQVGLFSSSQRAENLSLATHLARCRMNETEVELLKDGYPIIEESKDEGPCCEDESESRFDCKRLIQRIELPQPAGTGADGGTEPGSAPGAVDGGAINAFGPNPFAPGAGGADPMAALGPLGALASIQQSGGQALSGASSLGNFLGGGSGEAAAAAQGLVPMLMGMVYPDLKRMLEASIRKITITVHWKEGRNERELAVTQFVANPMQGGLDPNAAKGLEALDNAAGAFGPALSGAQSGSSSSQTGTGTSTTTPGSSQ
ncbi:MAG TPA: type II secretion system protein [Polyangiaceae bacterium]|nr:type II secretion system protein [Polyangiaceae bacterium]